MVCVLPSGSSAVRDGGLVASRVVHLFEGPYVTVDGRQLSVPRGSKRLLAFLALRRCQLERQFVAGVLWPEVDDTRAAGNLRSSLWRLRKAGIEVVACDKWSMRLSDGVFVDVLLVTDWANRLIHREPLEVDLTLAGLPADALDLLPGWCDDWAIVERERMRQRVLHAMEALSVYLTAQHQFADAIEVAMAAVADEPLRESAQRVLIEAYLGQGNRAAAEETYQMFRRRLRRELGVEPSAQMAASLDVGRGRTLIPGAAGVG
jgi:DNA-binding SARP family transcriptional activator